MGTSYPEYYQKQLEAGQRFQDYIASRLYDEGIVLVNFQSREAQQEDGENKLGLEIKWDDKLAQTGNVWIEVEEKSDPQQPRYVPSGIDRDDGTWLYGIGDYREFFVFSKRTLRKYRQHTDPTIVENGTKTSRAFLLPRQLATELAELMFYWSETEK